MFTLSTGDADILRGACQTRRSTLSHGDPLQQLVARDLQVLGRVPVPRVAGFFLVNHQPVRPRDRSSRDTGRVDNSQTAKDRAAHNEALFRQVNERVKDVGDAFSAFDPSPIDFVCECGRRDCAAEIALTTSEYELIRKDPTHFLVLPDHVIPEVETVVRDGDGYVVVAKLPGEREIAVETDPRSRS